MATPKFIESPNTVQTSLYGYDRNKKVQLNSLRGRPIVVLRSDNGNVPEKRSDAPVEKVVHSRPTKKWIDRSNHFPPPLPNKPMYPSYAHFHHQYSCSKTDAPPPFPHPPQTSTHDRKSPRRPTPPNSPKMSAEEELSAKKVFDKLNIMAGNSGNSGAISTEITLLELNPKIAAKKTFSTTCPSIFEPPESSSESSESDCDVDDQEKENAQNFLLDTPRSLSFVTTNSTCHSKSLSNCTNSGDESLCEVTNMELQHGEGLQEQLEQTELHEIQEPPVLLGHSCGDETHCNIFHGGMCSSDNEERSIMLRWYDDLIQWRHDIVTKRRIGPPRCPPAPLTVTLIGASRAQRANPFQRVRDVHPFQMEAMEHARKKMEHRRSHRLVPMELPLPPPHEFISNAKCMEPHLFVEYCYQLTAAAYVDSGLNPPHRRPPIPPRVEPIPEQFCRESICSSASEISSDGEYSDDSEGTKEERFRQKMERHTRRERRLQQMFRRRRILDEIDEEDDD